MNEVDRRPIASREQGWAKNAARLLARGNVTPNTISVLGMIAGVLAGVALAATAWDGFEIAGFVLAAILIQLRLLANMFDGMVALEQRSDSPLGTLYNEVPDRVSDVATLIGAGFAWGGSPTLGFVAALLAVFIAYIRAQGRVAGAPQEFCGPMAKQQRMAVITIAALLAVAIPSGWQPMLESPASWGIMALALAVVIAGEVVTVARRLHRIGRALTGSPPEVEP